MTFAQLQASFKTFTHNANVDSTERNYWLNEGYNFFVRAKDWRWSTIIYSDALVANQANYPLPTLFRKWDFLRMNGIELEEVRLTDFLLNKLTDQFDFKERTGENVYTIEEDGQSILIDPFVKSDSSSVATSNAESAGTSVTIEVPSTTDLSVGDYIIIEGSTGGVTKKEISSLTAVVASTSVTCRLANSYDAGATIRNIKEGLFGRAFVDPTDLSADADTPIGPIRLHLAIAKSATSLYFASIEQDNLATFWMNEFTKDINEEWSDPLETSTRYEV